MVHQSTGPQTTVIYDGETAGKRNAMNCARHRPIHNNNCFHKQTENLAMTGCESLNPGS